MEGGPRGYFGADTGRRKRYYGVKRMINFQKKFPLSQYSYAPLARGQPLSLQTYGASYKTATPAQRAARKEFMMSGRGKYAMTGRGGFFGRMLGGLFGQPDLGDKIGDAAWSMGKQFLPTDYANLGDAAFNITDKLGGRGLYRGRGLYKGRGAYAVNNLITDGGATASNVVPDFNPTDLHEVTYSNKEFVRDIYAPSSGTVFQIDSWNLNPGLVQAFPWLSQLALNFEEYEFIQLAFTYKSTVADFASASGQVGQIAMATQYNPNSDSFADKEEMMLYQGGMSCKTTESLIHGIECDPSKLAGAAQKYVRQGSLPMSEDLKNYDLGKTSIAVLNVPSTYAGQQIGELWVSYTVRLRKPKLVSANAYNVRIDNFAHYNTANVATDRSALAIGSLMIGARNSLGCVLTSGANATNQATTATWDNLTADLVGSSTTAGGLTGTQQQFTITFPPDYSGVISLRIQLSSTTALGWALQLATERTSTIKRFRDIPQLRPANTSTAVWTHYRATVDNSADGGGLFSTECEIHLRILPATGGNANSIVVSTTGPVTGVLCFPRIQFTQINSFCSVADNGSNDRLDLVTTSGQPAVWANM